MDIYIYIYMRSGASAATEAAVATSGEEDGNDKGPLAHVGGCLPALHLRACLPVRCSCRVAWWRGRHTVVISYQCSSLPPLSLKRSRLQDEVHEGSYASMATHHCACAEHRVAASFFSRNATPPRFYRREPTSVGACRSRARGWTSMA